MAVQKQKFTIDSWPGFVDALAALVMVFLFLLIIFIYGHFSLNATLDGRNKALDDLNLQLSSIAQDLNIKEQEKQALQTQLTVLDKNYKASQQTIASLSADKDLLTSQLQNITQTLATQKDIFIALEQDYADLKQQYAQTTTNFENDITSLQTDFDALLALKEKLNAQLTEKTLALTAAQDLTESEKRKLVDAQAALALTQKNAKTLNDQIAELSQLLRQYEAQDKEQQVQIVNLGEKLNQALASKVSELNQYRSEFFGQLKDVLGNNADIRVEGDRFILQSEILFDKGMAILNETSITEMQKVANIIINISNTIPNDIDWIIRVDGHTDALPIQTAQFPSNWELSAARAISVTKQLIAFGVPPKRLVAAGFAELHPIDTRDDEIAHRRNRRIEFKLTNR